MRRLLPALLALMSALPLLARAEEAAAKLVLGVADTLCKKCACSCVGDNAKRDYAGTAAAVKAATGVSLEFKYYEEPSLLADEIKAGRLDGVIAKTWTGLTLARDSGRRFDRLADVRMPEGEPDGLTGVFIVPAASPAKTLADLRGKRIVFGPDADYEKSHAARAALRAAAVPPAPGLASEVPSCKTAVIHLQENRADAAVISSYAMRYGCISVVAEEKDFREIGRTAPAIPFVSVFLDERVPAPRRAEIRAALLKLSGKSAPADLFSAGFAAPAPWAPRELAPRAQR